MIERYAFYGQAAKLDKFYDKGWAESLRDHNTATFNKLVDIAVAKGYHPDIASKDITGWVKLADPACADYDERYRAVSTTKKSKDWELVESLTLPGLMTSIIEEAKTSKARYIPRTHRGHRWLKDFIAPGREWYNPLFAKDLYKVKPEWCEYSLSEDEQKELLAYMIDKTGKVPNGRDPWIVPKEHPLAKFKGTLRPLASKAFKSYGKKGLIVNMIEQSLKKGVKPKEWNWFEYNYSEDAKRLRVKYPKITNQQQWLKDNLTPAQQEKVDKWKRIAELVLNDLDDYTLVKGMTKEERSIVGNHLKMLDTEIVRTPDKARITIQEIKEKIKQQRPILYNLYCHTKLETTSNILSEWMRDVENKEKHKEFIEKANTGIDYQDMSKEERYSLSSFTRKGTKYPEFKKQIEQMRPDWFDEKLRKKLIRERHFTKKKEMYNEQY